MSLVNTSTLRSTQHTAKQVQINRNPLRNWFLNFAGNFATRALDRVETRVILVVQEVGRQNFNAAPVHQRIELWYKLFEMYQIGTPSGFFGDKAARSSDLTAVLSKQCPQTQAQQAWRHHVRHLIAMLCEGMMLWVVSLLDENSEDVVKVARTQKERVPGNDENRLDPAEPSSAAR
ncbi:hypothetical protein CBER1_03116 [Cercospora berteroae]|uniref:Uncharacterized protein n=1 Tax=Cercospora berteroae TaxID=357750 RepID=A0A2S6CK84_9PEZI|nr:hypothetical protein CBER1_03116 [Cercospora berteroae]